MGMRRRSLTDVAKKSTSANVTIENVKGSWGESSKTVSGYRVYESKGSYNVNNGYDLAKVTFSGYPSFTFLYGSYAESSYDYMRISPLDYASAQNWTGSSSTGYLLSTSGKQSSSAPNLSYTFTNDGGEHFFYILYRKDSSVNSGADRGYIAFRQSNYLDVDNTELSITHSSQTIEYTINSDVAWSADTSDEWILLSSTQGNGNGRLQIQCTLNEGSERVGYVTFTSQNTVVKCKIQQAAYTFNIPNSVTIKYGVPYLLQIEAELGLSVTYDCPWLECDVVNGDVGQNLKLTALTDFEENQTCQITVTSSSISKIINVKLLSSLEYISDGLVFEIDGTDKQATADYCLRDKVGGITFTNIGGVEELENGFRFTGANNSYLAGSRCLNGVQYNSCTIEVVIKSELDYNTWGPVVIFGDWYTTEYSEYIGVSINYESTSRYNHAMSFVARARDGYTYSYIIPHNTIITAALKSNTPIIINNNTYDQTAYQSHNTVSSDGRTYIGGRAHGSGSYIKVFKGDIYAIRVYNRILTEDEIAHNQYIDILKYNILV